MPESGPTPRRTEFTRIRHGSGAGPFNEFLMHAQAHVRENRQLDSFNRLRAGGRANRLFPAAK
jgi:hypothetical protein